MRTSRFKTMVWVVACAVIALLAVTTGSAVVHELEHVAHHSDGIHLSGICAWMCATAGTHVAMPLHVTHLFALISLIPFDSVQTLFYSTACLPPRPPSAHRRVISIPITGVEES